MLPPAAARPSLRPSTPRRCSTRHRRGPRRRLELEGVDEDVAEGIVRDGDGDRPQPGPDLLDRGQDVEVPSILLACAGDDDHARHGTRGGSQPQVRGVEWATGRELAGPARLTLRRDVGKCLKAGRGVPTMLRNGWPPVSAECHKSSAGRDGESDGRSARGPSVVARGERGMVTEGIRRPPADELTRWRDRCNRLISTCPDAFLEVDAAGLVIEWNPRAEELFGWSRSEVIGRPARGDGPPRRARTVAVPSRRRPRRGAQR